MIFGVTTTKSAVVIAESTGAGARFVLTSIRPVPFQARSGEELIELRKALGTIFDRKGKGDGRTRGD